MQDDGAANAISEVTRRNIVDYFSMANVSWAGRLAEDDFLARLYDLTKMPSHDHRFSDAGGDIWQHRVNNFDWGGEDWVFTDGRFNLLHAPDAEFLRFLCETIHPVVRPDESTARELAAFYNQNLVVDGWLLSEAKLVSGKPIFEPRSATRAVVFEEPTGWRKVDRQLQEIRLHMNTAETEEQWQGVGLLCREVLISVAQEMFDPRHHPLIDETQPSETDARRMLESIFEGELDGATNGEARAHAKAAVKLALALQHKRAADFRTAALCAEGTVSVVNMLAIIAGRRSRRA